MTMVINYWTSESNWFYLGSSHETGMNANGCYSFLFVLGGKVTNALLFISQ